MAPNFLQQQLVQSGQFSCADLKEIASYRGQHSRLGFAYQLIHVRLLNYFPKQNPFEVIEEILLFAGLQLDIEPHRIDEYKKYRQHIARHQEYIRDYLRLAAFTEDASMQLCEFLFEEAQRLEHTSLLLLEAKQFLRIRLILQPGEDALMRLVGAQRERARQYIFSRLTSLLSKQIIIKLDDLLIVKEGRPSTLQQLKYPPAAPSADALLNLINKLELIGNTKILKIDMSWLNNNYQRSQAKYVQRCSVDRLRDLRPEHRYTALACFLHQLRDETVDHMLDMYFKLITKIYRVCQGKIDSEMLRKRKDIKITLRMFTEISHILLDEAIPELGIRTVIFDKVNKEEMQLQVSESEPLLKGKWSHVFKLVVARFPYLRRFAPKLLEYVDFESAPKNKQGARILKAVRVLREMNLEKNFSALPKDVPLDFIPTKQQILVAPDGVVDRASWECALLTAVRDDTKAGNLSVKNSKRHGRISDFYMPKAEWEKYRSYFFKRANLPENKKEVPAYLTARLNDAYDQFLAREEDNLYAQIKDGKWVFSVDQAETFSPEETAALQRLRSFFASHMRSIKLPELLIEVDNDLHFTKSFLPSAKQEKREAEDIFGVLVAIMAQGCFMGAYTMSRLTQGISYEQIRRIIDWQLTEDAQRSALATIVNAMSRIEITKQWGEGKTSSSDGQRFEYRRKSLHKTYSVKFSDFALEFYTFVADNFAPYFSTPKEATDRDAPFVLDGILYNESDLNIEEHYTDTHGYTEINFAAFAMLGKKFSPRIRGVQRQRIYRIDKNKDYGSLLPLVSSSDRLIHMDWIVEKWDEMAHFYASLEKGHATASVALKRIAGLSEKNAFYRANREFGRILKTEDILLGMSDPLIRKNRRRGLLKGEQIHQLGRDVAYAKRGKVPARDLQEQQNTCSCLTLIIAAIVYWQTKEMKRAIDEHGQHLDELALSMLAHVSPVSWDNVLLYGEYVVDKSLIR